MPKSIQGDGEGGRPGGTYSIFLRLTLQLTTYAETWRSEQSELTTQGTIPSVHRRGILRRAVLANASLDEGAARRGPQDRAVTFANDAYEAEIEVFHALDTF